jgi:hypothetical protein
VKRAGVCAAAIPDATIVFPSDAAKTWIRLRRRMESVPPGSLGNKRSFTPASCCFVLRCRARCQPADGALVDAEHLGDRALRLASVKHLQRMRTLMRRQLRLAAEADTLCFGAVAPGRRARPD